MAHPRVPDCSFSNVEDIYQARMTEGLISHSVYSTVLVTFRYACACLRGRCANPITW